MKKIIVIAGIISLPWVTACSDGNGQSPLPFAETTVTLEGAIGSSTRAVIGSGYEKDLDVCFARQDETAGSSGNYGPWSVCKAVRSGGKGNRPIVFADPQSYPEDGRSIRLHGYYPAEGEPVAGTGKVVFTVDGVTDIMATGRLTGSGYDPARTCTFRHLLTQVRLVCYSNCPAEWGVVKNIEAVDVHTRQELDWGQETPSLADVSTEGEIKNIPVQEIAGLAIPEVATEGDLPDPQGYLLLPVSPVDGTAEHPLHLRITTTKDGRGIDGETVSDVFLRIEGGLRTGKSHIITLFFTDKTGIQTLSVGVTSWAEYEQGEMPI